MLEIIQLMHIYIISMSSEIFDLHTLQLLLPVVLKLELWTNKLLINVIQMYTTLINCTDQFYTLISDKSCNVIILC